MSIERHGKTTVDEARRLAKEGMGQVTKGATPTLPRTGLVRHGESAD